MKRYQQFMIDLFIITVSFFLAYYFRFSGLFSVEKGIPSFGKYIVVLPLILITFSVCLASIGLYRRRDQIISLDIIGEIVLGASIGTIFLMSFTFFYRGFSYSRFVALFALIFSVILLVLTRMITRVVLRYQYKHGRGGKRIALVGLTKLGRILVKNIQSRPELGYQLVGVYSSHSPLEHPDIPPTGRPEEVLEQIDRGFIDEVYLTATLPRDFLLEVIIHAEAMDINVRMIPDFLEIFTSRLQPELALGLPLLSLKKFPLNSPNRALKRIFDLSISIPAFIVILPLFVIISMLVKITSPGPVFYRQVRVGQDGKRFELLKFRSMYKDAESETGPIWARQKDERRTGLGKLLRRLSLDELPQLWNVICNDMSLVGPRPERPVFVEQFSSQIPRYLERLRVKSGLTGWAQVNGFRGNTSIEDRIEHDLYYIENWSLWFDVKILLLTLLAVFRGNGAV